MVGRGWGPGGNRGSRGTRGGTGSSGISTPGWCGCLTWQNQGKTMQKMVRPASFTLWSWTTRAAPAVVPLAGRDGGGGSPIASGAGAPSGVLATAGVASSPRLRISSSKPARGTSGPSAIVSSAATWPVTGPSARTMTPVTTLASRHPPPPSDPTTLRSPLWTATTSAGAWTSTRVVSTIVPAMGAPPPDGNSHASGDQSCVAGICGPQGSIRNRANSPVSITACHEVLVVNARTTDLGFWARTVPSIRRMSMNSRPSIPPKSWMGSRAARVAGPPPLTRAGADPSNLASTAMTAELAVARTIVRETLRERTGFRRSRL